MNALTTTNINPEVIEKLVIKGDLSDLSRTEKISYYNMICNRVGVDPAMQPFKLLNLQGKQVLYLDRSGAQQLNKLHSVSHEVRSREMIHEAGVYQVTARATLPDGRYTDSIGAVNIAGLKGDAYANAIMKAETKAKRRATLDLLGLGMLDETEVETIPNAVVEQVVEEDDLELLRSMVYSSTLDLDARDRALAAIENCVDYATYSKILHRLEEVQYDHDTVTNPNQKDIKRKVKQAVERDNT